MFPGSWRGTKGEGSFSLLFVFFASFAFFVSFLFFSFFLFFALKSVFQLFSILAFQLFRISLAHTA